LKVAPARRIRWMEECPWAFDAEMTTDTKSPKPMPSAAEINAYLEQSAARTKLRLPLAKGAAVVQRGAAAPAAAAPAAAPAPVAQSAKKLPTQPSGPVAGPVKAAPAADVPADEAWRPFSSDDDR
jgi:hypothetical protein